MKTSVADTFAIGSYSESDNLFLPFARNFTTRDM